MGRSPAAAGFSSPGRRSENEDAWAIVALAGGGWAASVADGMGGHSHGRAASEAAVAAFDRAFADGRSADRDALEKAFAAAVDAVVEKTRELASEDSGTTLVAAAVGHEGIGWIAHAGDSAAVLVTRGSVRRITVDHSFVAEQIQLGQMTEIESYSHPLRNAITRALGATPVSPDWNEVPAGEPGVLVLATDGVLKFLGDAEIAGIVQSAGDADDAVRRLVLQAIRNGGDDNATAVAMAVGAWTWQKPRRRWRAVAAVALLTIVLAAAVGVILYQQSLPNRSKARHPAAPARHTPAPSPQRRRR